MLCVSPTSPSPASFAPPFLPQRSVRLSERPSAPPSADGVKKEEGDEKCVSALSPPLSSLAPLSSSSSSGCSAAPTSSHTRGRSKVLTLPSSVARCILCKSGVREPSPPRLSPSSHHRAVLPLPGRPRVGVSSNSVLFRRLFLESPTSHYTYYTVIECERARSWAKALFGAFECSKIRVSRENSLP